MARLSILHIWGRKDRYAPARAGSGTLDLAAGRNYRKAELALWSPSAAPMTFLRTTTRRDGSRSCRPLVLYGRMSEVRGQAYRAVRGVPSLFDTHIQTLYVFLVFDHARREVLHLAITPHPTMEWVIQQLREATPFGCQPRFVFRDNDGIYGHGVRAFLISCGILEVRTAYQNPYIERFIGTLRRELLDHVIVLHQAHLERLLKKFIEDYYHPARPHQGLRGETPVPQAPPGEGELISVPVVGGLHHRYCRAAA